MLAHQKEQSRPLHLISRHSKSERRYAGQCGKPACLVLTCALGVRANPVRRSDILVVQAERVRAAGSASTSGSSQPSAHSKGTTGTSPAIDKAEGVSVKAAASNSSHAAGNGSSKAEGAASKPAGQTERLPAKASSSDSKSPLANSTNKVQAAAKKAADKTQQPAVPATGSAALLARIRWVLCYCLWGACLYRNATSASAGRRQCAAIAGHTVIALPLPMRTHCLSL